MLEHCIPRKNQYQNLQKEELEEDKRRLVPYVMRCSINNSPHNAGRANSGPPPRTFLFPLYNFTGLNHLETNSGKLVSSLSITDASPQLGRTVVAELL
jgi:hypothetical protein